MVRRIKGKECIIFKELNQEYLCYCICQFQGFTKDVVSPRMQETHDFTPVRLRKEILYKRLADFLYAQ